MNGLLILGIDTSCACAKAALFEEGTLLAEEYVHDRRTHSVKLMPMIDKLYKEAEKEVSRTELVGVITGPGSFTGLRIGTAAAKAIAYAAKATVVGINTLEFLSRSVTGSEEAIICPVIDARNTSVYCCAYIEGNAVWDCRVRAVKELSDALRRLSEETGRFIVLTGDGADPYLELFKESLGSRCTVSPEAEQLGTAGMICRMAWERRAQSEDCFSLNVNYYRQTQAERMKYGQNG